LYIHVYIPALITEHRKCCRLHCMVVDIRCSGKK